MVSGRIAWRTTKQAANILGCCPQTVLKFVKAGKLPADRIYGTSLFRYRLTDIEKIKKEEFLS